MIVTLEMSLIESRGRAYGKLVSPYLVRMAKGPLSERNVVIRNRSELEMSARVL